MLWLMEKKLFHKPVKIDLTINDSSQKIATGQGDDLHD